MQIVGERGARALARLGSVALVLWAAAGRPAWADGTQTGLITGQVVDASGAGVAAVQVTVVGPQIRRAAIADDQGRFRFPALGLGTYDVHAELLGLTADRRGVRVSIGRTTEIALRLGGGPDERGALAGAAGAADGAEAVAAEPSSQASIQVWAEPSVIDRFDTRIGANVSFDFLDHLPLPRYYQAVPQLLPGVADSGGGSGGDGNPNVNGALRSDNQFLIDGVDTTDPATGLFGLNLAYQSIQEVSVTTAAAPAEYGRSSGGVVNVVTRSGTNDYQGLVRLLAADRGWDSPYRYPARQAAAVAPEIEAANNGPSRIDPTLGLALGGPLWRDHVWFFGAYDDSQSTFMAPTLQGTTWNRGAEVEASAAKLSWQVNPTNTVVGQFTNDTTRFGDFDPFDRGEAENRVGGSLAMPQSSLVGSLPGDIFALERQVQDGNFEKLQWNSALRQDMSAEITLAQQRSELTRQPLDSRGLTADAPHVVPVGAAGAGATGEAADALALYNGITDQGFERRPRRQGNLVLNGFVQIGPTDHELKTGVDFQRTVSERRFDVPGAVGVDPATGRPVDGQLFFDQGFDPNAGTFQPGQMYQFWDRGTTRTIEQTYAVYLSDAIAVERWLVSVGGRYESVRATDSALGPLLDNSSVAPRLAVTFDASGDHKVLLLATYGRYYDPFLHSYLDSYASDDVLSGYTPYTWQAADPACAGQSATNLGSPCWVAGTPVGFAPQLTGGANQRLHRSWLDEATLGFERQVTASVGVSLYYIHRRWHDLWDNVVEGVFDPAGTLVGTTSQVVNLPAARRQQQSLQLLVQKRYSEHWQLLGSYTRSRTEGNLFDDTGAGSASFANFQAVSDVNLVDRYGLAPYDRRDQVKIFSSYRWPWRGVDMSLGTVLLYESGLPYQEETLDPLGVRFLTPRGSLRLPDVFEVDLSLGSEFQLVRPGLVLEVKAEVFNATDQKQVLGVQTLLDSGQFGQPRSIADLQAPRTYRMTLGLRF